MTANLFIASYNVLGPESHAYLIYDPNTDGDNNYETELKFPCFWMVTLNGGKAGGNQRAMINKMYYLSNY
jgi:hypothetical protein